MFFQIIETSSAGNCAYINYGGKNVLIDAGIGVRKIKEYLKSRGLELADLDAVFITHEHSDHCKALKSLVAYKNLSVYANRDTRESILYSYPETKNLNWKEFCDGDTIDFYGWKIVPFNVPHDTNDCVGYCFRLGSEELVWATDLGWPTKVVIDAASRASILVLESNYCPIMLDESERPYRLKIRISSRNGHLSNADAISVLKTLSPDKIRKVFLAHISAECNRCQHISDLLSAESALAPIVERIEIIPPRGHSSSPFEL